MNISLSHFIATLEIELGQEPGTLSPEEELSAIADLDSIGRLSLIALCDSQFGFVLKVPDLDACRTVAELHALVEAHATRL
jgi:acyl carrier protein